MAADVSLASGDLDTFPKCLLRNARQWPDRPAMREKNFGIWQTWTWSRMLDEVRAYALGLKELGVRPGDKIAIIGDNRPRLYWTFVAAQSLGCIPVPVYQDAVADEMVYVLDHAGVVLAVVENQEQVDKVLSIADRIPSLKQLVYDEARGLRDYDHKKLHSIDQVIARGREELEKDPGAAAEWQASVAKGGGEDVAVILYTSGTTGTPKGVVLSNTNVIWAGRTGNEFDGLKETDEVIAYLPMAWVGDHIFSYAQAYLAGFCVNCPESPETVVTDRREIGTTYAFAPPRIYENLITLTMVRMEDAGWLKKKMFHYYLGVARKWGEKILDGARVPLAARLNYMLGDLLVYGPIKNRFGLSRIRVAYTAGEAIGPEIFRFYRALGLNLKQLYGQTEASVYITMQPDGEIFAETVGTPAPDIEIRIDRNGEVLFRSPGVFVEYYKNKDATAKTKTKDGWVHTGDAGLFDDNGHLKIIDRAKDVGRVKNGALFPPKYIENKLKFYPNIKEVVAFGDKRDHVACMINIDTEAVGNWAERHNLSYGSYQELAGHPDVYAMIEAHVDEVNRQLAAEPDVAGAQIARFLILHKELDADDGELTRTQKVRRSYIADRYGPLVTALYDGSTEKHVETQVTYEDGRKGVLAATVKIRDMQTYPVSAPIKEAAE